MKVSSPVYCTSRAENHVSTIAHTHARAHGCVQIYMYIIYIKYKDKYIYIYIHTGSTNETDSIAWPRGNGSLIGYRVAMAGGDDIKQVLS